MIRAVADTHTFIWYLGSDKRLSTTAREFINDAAHRGDTVAVSSISLFETVYLIERNRVPTETLARLTAELLSPDSIFVETPPNYTIATIMQKVLASQIPELPDRIVAATALYLGVPVISRDGQIQASSIQTIW